MTHAVLSARLAALELALERWCEHPRRLLALLAALLLAQVGPWWYASPDSLTYLSVARSLAGGHGLLRLGSEQLGYPPGYPLLASPAFLISGRPFLRLSLLQWALAVGLLLGVYRWLRARHCTAALLLTGTVMVNAALWLHYRRPLSELAFMAVMVWAANAWDMALAVPAPRRAVGWTVLGSVLSVLLCLIREVGGVLVTGFALATLVAARRRRFSRTFAFAMIGIAALPAAVTVVGFAHYDVRAAARSADQRGTHLDGFINASPLFAGTASPLVPLSEMVRVRVSEVGRLLVPGMLKSYGPPGRWLDVNMLVYLPLCALVLAGWWQLVRQGPDVLALTLPFYLAIYLVWPFDGGLRYLLPLLPVLLLCGWLPLGPRLRRPRCALAAFLVAHLGVALGYWLADDLPRIRQCHAQWDVAERLAAQVPARSAGLADGVPECIRLLLAYSVDRSVLEMPAAGLAQTNEPWIVAPAGAPSPAGFAASAVTHPYQIFVRVD
ncbi:MAG: hypothetical protein HY699_16610 [Deltaproteobacteria bacterium]|nr:hypothetical protein [Deltaproteobacteria bacterium]